MSVDVQAEDNASLVDKFDKFAATHNMIVTTSLGAHTYETPDTKSVVDVTLGLGKFGAVVTFYRFETGADQLILIALTEFIRTDIASRWMTTPCANIEGFGTPEIWR